MMEENAKLREAIELEREERRQYYRAYNETYARAYYLRNREKILAREKLRYERIKRYGKKKKEVGASKQHNNVGHTKNELMQIMQTSRTQTCKGIQE